MEPQLLRSIAAQLMVATTSLAIVAVALLATPASGESMIAVSPSRAAAGTTVTVSGNIVVSGASSCPAEAAALLTSTADLFPPDGFGPRVARDPHGSFIIDFAIPATTPLGGYEIGVRCGGGSVGVRATLQVAVKGSALARVGAAPSDTAPGGTITIAGVVPIASCPATDAVQLTSTADLFPPDGFGPRVARDSSGGFSTDFAIPATTPEGVYDIGVRCGGGTVGVSTTVHVAASTTSTSGATMTSTTEASVTTTAPAPSARDGTGTRRWIALGTLAVVVVAATAWLLRRKARASAR